MAKKVKRTPIRLVAARSSARGKIATALGAAVGALLGQGLHENPELIGQGVLALQLQFEGQGRSKEQADVVHYIIECAKNAKGLPPTDAENTYMMPVDCIKAGIHLGTAEVAHASIFDDAESFLKSNPWSRAGSSESATPPKPKKGRKS